jgi:hypothetical protein
LCQTDGGQVICANVDLSTKELAVKKAGLVLTMFLMSAAAAIAQTAPADVKPLTDDDIRLFRQDLQSVKGDVIRHTMLFSAAEDKAFWPVYNEYAAAQHGIADKRLAVIADYAKNFDTLSDATASSLSARMLQVDDDTQALRKSYLPKFEAAIGAKRAAKFYQVDNRLTLIINVQLASEIPLIP